MSKISIITNLCLALFALTNIFSNASIIRTGDNAYVVNCAANQCGLLDYYPPVEVLDVTSGVWRFTPVNPDINPLATYMAWNCFGNGTDWVWGMGVYDLATLEQIGGMAHGVYQSTPEAAFYADPPFQPLDIIITEPTSLCFVTGDSYIADNQGGASILFELIAVFGPQLIMQEPKVSDNAVFTDPNGINSVRLLWDENISFTNNDMEIINEKGDPVSCFASGTGSQFMTLSFETLFCDKYTITIYDSVISAETGYSIDGDEDGFAGGDAVIVMEHRQRQDLNNDNNINLFDLSGLAEKWLWEK